MYTSPSTCPTCGHDLEVRELSCPACETTVRGRWSPGPFGRLSDDQQNFLRIFVRSRGNLSEVERSLGVSYPTVRAKLEEIIDLFQENQAPSLEPAQTRDDILRQIAAGSMSVDDGLSRIRQLDAQGENSHG